MERAREAWLGWQGHCTACAAALRSATGRSSTVISKFQICVGVECQRETIRGGTRLRSVIRDTVDRWFWVVQDARRRQRSIELIESDLVRLAVIRCWDIVGVGIRLLCGRCMRRTSQGVFVLVDQKYQKGSLESCRRV